jgi:hypothetical protein
LRKREKKNVENLFLFFWYNFFLYKENHFQCGKEIEISQVRKKTNRNNVLDLDP